MRQLRLNSILSLSSFPPHVFLHPAANWCVTRLTLAHILARITTEYGPSFANVTEDKLQSQINKQQDEDVEMEDVADQDETKKAVTREELIRIVQ
jgi:Subunit 17 of Mediator complex